MLNTIQDQGDKEFLVAGKMVDQFTLSVCIKTTLLTKILLSYFTSSV